jgi:hypothetical protein
MFSEGLTGRLIRCYREHVRCLIMQEHNIQPHHKSEIQVFQWSVDKRPPVR